MQHISDKNFVNTQKVTNAPGLALLPEKIQSPSITITSQMEPTTGSTALEQTPLQEPLLLEFHLPFLGALHE